MENFVTTTCEFSLRVPRTYKYILYADHYMYGSALCVCQCNGHCSLSITKHAGPASLQYFNMGIGWSNNFWCGHKLHPDHACPPCLQSLFGGRTLLVLGLQTTCPYKSACTHDWQFPFHCWFLCRFHSERESQHWSSAEPSECYQGLSVHRCSELSLIIYSCYTVPSSYDPLQTVINYFISHEELFYCVNCLNHECNATLYLVTLWYA